MKRAPVMQEVTPPPRRGELRQDHGTERIGVARNAAYGFDEWLLECPERRVLYFERDRHLPFRPLALDRLDLPRMKREVKRPRLAGAKRTRVVDGQRGGVVHGGHEHKNRRPRLSK